MPHHDEESGWSRALAASAAIVALLYAAGLASLGAPPAAGDSGALAVETVTIFGSSGFTEPGGPMNLQLGAGLVWAWMLAFAAWGTLRGRRA